MIDGTWLAATAGAILSLLFEYVPGLSTWYETLSEAQKRLVMLVLLVVTAAGVFGLSCYTPAPVDWVTCDVGGIWGLITALIAAIVANQGIHLMAKKPAAA